MAAFAAIMISTRKRPSKSINVIVEAGDASPILPVGINSAN